MSMNVSTTTAAYANYQNNYKTGTANKKKKQHKQTENTKLKKNTTESYAWLENRYGFYGCRF